MKKIAVVLSGCGHEDGTEITEAVSLIIGLSQNGAKISFFAPNMEYKSSKTGDVRNALIESARISRGQINDVKDLNVKDFDGLAFPGGFGAAVNLCNWAERGANCEVREDIKKIILDFYKASKPIGAICIAPVLLAKVLGPHLITITLGDSDTVANEIKKTGAVHEHCPVDDFVSDRDHKIITTPAYMYSQAQPFEVFKGIFGLSKELVEMA